MAKHLWALCCEDVIIDSPSNNVTLINVFEQFIVPRLPVVIPRKNYVASLWQRELPASEDERFHLKFVIHSEGEEPNESNVPDIELTIPRGNASVRHFGSLQGITVRRAGNLFVKIMMSQNGERVSSWTEEAKITIKVSL